MNCRGECLSDWIWYHCSCVPLALPGSSSFTYLTFFEIPAELADLANLFHFPNISTNHKRQNA